MIKADTHKSNQSSFTEYFQPQAACYGKPYNTNAIDLRGFTFNKLVAYKRLSAGNSRVAMKGSVKNFTFFQLIIFTILMSHKNNNLFLFRMKIFNNCESPFHKAYKKTTSARF